MPYTQKQLSFFHACEADPNFSPDCPKGEDLKKLLSHTKAAARGRLEGIKSRLSRTKARNQG